MLELQALVEELEAAELPKGFGGTDCSVDCPIPGPLGVRTEPGTRCADANAP